jgi:hypothetical protein
MELRILDNNFLDLAILANTDVTSEQAAFPVENAYNKNRRSKVWRSAGYFNITSANNKIIFEEVSGVTLTASIIVGEYASLTAICLGIKTALELVGANTYTVLNSSATNYKFRFTSNGGFFELKSTDINFTAASILGIDTSADLTGALTYDADVLRTNTLERITWDMGLSSIPTCFALIGPKTEPLKISPNAVLKLQANLTNNWTSPAFEKILTYDSEVISELDLTNTVAYRYWSLLIQDQNTNGFEEVGAFFLGTHFSFEKAGVILPLQNTQIDRSETIYSEGGQEFSDMREKTNSFNVTLNGMSELEIEKLEQFFLDFGTSSPFFVSLDDDLQYSSTVNRKIKYVKLASDMQITNTSNKFFSVSMNLMEQL